MRRVLAEGAGDMEVWEVDLDAQADGATASDSHERARAGRMMPQAAQRYLTGRRALREVLGRVMRCAPQDIRLDADALGKPRAPGLGLYFSSSRSGSTGLIAVSLREPVGIDVENLRTMRNAARLAELHFTAAEREEWSRAGSDAAFLRCWTRKEACLKALGVGLRVEPALVDAGVDDGARTVMVPVRGREAHVVVHTLVGLKQSIGAIAFAHPSDVEHARRFAEDL